MKQRGFTLIEILLVITVISILMFALFPKTKRANTIAIENSAMAFSGQVHQALQTRLLQTPNSSPKTIIENDLGLPPFSLPLPSGYVRYPNGTVYSCTQAVNYSATVQWPNAPQDVLCFVDVDQTGNVYRVVTYPQDDTVYFVNGHYPSDN